MSLRNQQPQNRRSRRQDAGTPVVNSKQLELPGPLRILTNPKIFVGMGIIFIAAFIIGSFSGAIGTSTSNTDTGLPMQANQLPDAAPTEVNAEGTPQAAKTPQTAIKRYTTPPETVIDPTRTYVATVMTDQGELRIALNSQEAPQTVNSFIFLAREGYYNNNPAIIGKDRDGAAFTAAFGDPTGTGNVRPGYTTPREITNQGFLKGAVGMGDSQTAGNDGRFWFAFSDQPALSSRYTIFGQIISGAEVLQKLSQGGRILSVTVNES